MLRGKDVREVAEMKRLGMSIQAISKLLGLDRKTVRKYRAEVRCEAGGQAGVRSAAKGSQ